MKLSKETLAILKNFATINGNLLIKPGNTISTISASKSIYASATVSETFEHQIGIYDLNELLGMVASFDDPELNFTESVIEIGPVGDRITCLGANESVLTVPSKAIKVPAADIEFKLTADQVSNIQRRAGILRAQDIIIQGDGSKLKITVGDKKNSASNTNEIAIGDIDSTFKANIRIDNFKMIPLDYVVEIAAKKICSFKSGVLQYVVSLEADSSFED